GQAERGGGGRRGAPRVRASLRGAGGARRLPRTRRREAQARAAAGVLPDGGWRARVRPANRSAGERRPAGPGHPVRARAGLNRAMTASLRGSEPSEPAGPLQVVATAGHVDQGKSALVLRLTGMDPDRLAEEKRRGLTIDL